MFGQYLYLNIYINIYINTFIYNHAIDIAYILYCPDVGAVALREASPPPPSPRTHARFARSSQTRLQVAPHRARRARARSRYGTRE